VDAVHHLSIDIETYSDVDLTKAGLYRYAQSPAFTVLLFAYSLDGGPVQVLDLTTGMALPDWLISALNAPGYLKHAYNAAFEWYCLSQYLKIALPVDQWRCTMLHSMYCGYPGSLEASGRALGLAEDKQKLAAGKALIRYFCVPCNPTKTNGGRTRNLPHHNPDKWELFKTYNGQDVVTEMEIERKLASFPVPDEVQAQWVTDMRINARGVAVDMELVDGALQIAARERERHLQEACVITGLQNPNSPSQMIQWLNTQGVSVSDLQKGTVTELLDGELAPKVRRALEIRQELGKTSTKKYNALETAVCADGRVRGLLQFYGANRTGRWAGRIVQPQNLPRTYIAEDLLPLARDLVHSQNDEGLKLVFGSAADALSQLIRTAFVARPGWTLVDADFSAIEARVVAWLAGEEWVLDVFRTHGKIYEATASQLYGVPIEKIVKGKPEYALRQRGKAATLALGYAGGSSALIRAGGLSKDTPEEELLELRDMWRQNNPNIVNFWYTLDAAAMEVVQRGSCIAIQKGRMVLARECDVANGLDFMTVQLPSGRKLYYPYPHMGVNRFGKPSVCYWGVNQTTRKWEEIETYGGKLAENITQAVARDCLAEAIERLEAVGYQIAFHVHDEVVIDAPQDKANLDEVVRIMSVPPTWAPDLPLKADGWVNPFFKKD
jgi:DNA polymerase